MYKLPFLDRYKRYRCDLGPHRRGTAELTVTDHNRPKEYAAHFNSLHFLHTSKAPSAQPDKFSFLQLISRTHIGLSKILYCRIAVFHH